MYIVLSAICTAVSVLFLLYIFYICIFHVISLYLYLYLIILFFYIFYLYVNINIVTATARIAPRRATWTNRASICIFLFCALVINRAAHAPRRAVALIFLAPSNNLISRAAGRGRGRNAAIFSRAAPRRAHRAPLRVTSPRCASRARTRAVSAKLFPPALHSRCIFSFYLPHIC